MRTPRIFFSAVLRAGSELSLDVFTSHYVAHVLRLQVGSKLVVFNGEAEQHQAEIVAIKSKLVYLRLGEIVPGLEESPLYVHLAQGISRAERMDYAIQKAVELGVAEITPLLTERCGVKLDKRRTENRIKRWQSVIVHACEQSGRSVIPRLHPPQNYANWLGQDFSGSCFVCDPMAEKALSACSMKSRATLVIGPEGGLSVDEIVAAKEKAFQAVNLGPRVLRTETAAVVAVALLQGNRGDL